MRGSAVRVVCAQPGAAGAAACGRTRKCSSGVALLACACACSSSEETELSLSCASGKRGSHQFETIWSRTAERRYSSALLKPEPKAESCQNQKAAKGIGMVWKGSQCEELWNSVTLAA